MSQYISLYNETSGTFDSVIIDSATINTATVDTAIINTETVGTSNITNAIISNETVNTSTINNLTIGNVLYFPDGTVSLPSIAFANEHSTGFFRFGTNQIGLVTNGVLRALITNNGLVSVFDVQAGLQFLSNSSSVSSPSFSFVGDSDTGMYESAANEVSISCGNNQVASFNNSQVSSLRDLYCPRVSTTTNGSLISPALEIGAMYGFYRQGNDIYLALGGSLNAMFISGLGMQPGNLGYNLGNPGAEWNNLYCNNINSTGSSSFGGITCTSLNNSGTSTLSGAITAGSTFSNGTNAMTTGALSTTSISNSGTTTLTGAVSCGAITSTGNFSNSTNTMTTSSISNGSGNVFSVTSNVGSTTNGFNTFRVTASSPTAGLLYGLGIDKFGTEVAMLGVNKNSTTGQIPASAIYLSTYLSGSSISIGRGAGTGLPSNADILINGSGNVFCTNGTLTTTGVNNGTNAMTTGALSTTSINNSGTSILTGAITAGSTFSNGTNAMTTGALSTTSINNSGTTTLTGAVTCANTLTTGTNSITCGSLICPSIVPSGGSLSCTLTNSSVAGSPNFVLTQSSSSLGTFFGMAVNKAGLDTLFLGFNKNSTTGQVPANALYLSSAVSSRSLSIGRGNGSNNIDKADILIDGNGAITTTNNILVIRTCTGSQSINATSPTTFTTWDTSIVNQGNTTYSTGVFTIQTDGVYQCSYDVVWASNATGYRQCYISATAGVFAHSFITSPGALDFPQSGSASIKCAIGDQISLAVYQSSGGALNIASSGNFQVRISIVKIQ